jgi:cell division protein FtsN
MADNFSAETDEGKTDKGARGGNQRLLLLALLLLVAAFGYLYFFTGLIKPREEAPKAPPAPTAQVKQPLPPRPEQGGEKVAAKAAPVQPQPAPAKAEKPAPPAAPTPAKPPVAASANPAAAPAQPAPAKTAKPAEKSAEKPAAAPVAAGKKAPEPAAPAPKAAAAATPKAAAAAEKQDRFRLFIGELAAERDVRKVRAKLKKLGIAPVSEKKLNKPELMHRLFLAEFDNHYAADMELQKLLPYTANGFILEEKGQYAVYAGSYLHEKGAAAERDRLSGKGVKLDVKLAKVSIPVTRVTAGEFPGREDAQKAADRLKKQGISAQVIKAAK